MSKITERMEFFRHKSWKWCNSFMAYISHGNDNAEEGD